MVEIGLFTDIMISVFICYNCLTSDDSLTKICTKTENIYIHTPTLTAQFFSSKGQYGYIGSQLGLRVNFGLCAISGIGPSGSDLYIGFRVHFYSFR
jgi:hypothetical protein